MERIVVVGASLAGLRAADALRRNGFSGELHMVGAEEHPPYERPPLSKQFLAGIWEREKTMLELPDPFEVEWHLGRSAARLDVGGVLDDGGGSVALDDGTSLEFDGLVIACGASPRTLPGTEGIRGVFTLRTIDDAQAIRDAVANGTGSSGDSGVSGNPTRHIIVIGGGFIGSEVAATCAGRDRTVTIVDPLPFLMGRALGDRFGGFFAELHRSHGVELRLGVGVDRLESSSEGHVTGCLLSDGSHLDCDVAVVGIGVGPATGWLEGSKVGLDPVDRSVVCDSTCAVRDKSGGVLNGLVAAGDVARWDHELFQRPVRVEHWENAVAMGEAAAIRLLAGLSRSGKWAAYRDVPLFWSDLYDKKIQFVGLHLPGDDIQLVEGSLEEGRFLALYSRKGIITGALGVGRPARIIATRNLIAERAPIDTVL